MAYSFPSRYFGLLVLITSSLAHDTGGTRMGNATALQKHVAFFDRNGDGIIHPMETYEGFRAIGCGRICSILSAVLINGLLSHKTRPGSFPSLCFPIDIRNIHMSKHGSDSGIFDTHGRFVREKLNEMFEKYGRTRSDALTDGELRAMLKANREPSDPAGWVASYSEFMLLYKLCKEKDGFVLRNVIRGVYDGTLFYRMERHGDDTFQEHEL